MTVKISEETPYSLGLLRPDQDRENLQLIGSEVMNPVARLVLKANPNLITETA
jgi:hypothetical protein